MQLVLDSRGLKISKKNDLFFVESEKGSRSISPAKLTSIAITANVQIGADAIVLAIRHGIPILLFDRIGKAKARLWSPYFESIATLRRNQVRFGDTPEATAWVVDLFLLKTQAQADNLKFLHDHSGSLAGGFSAAIRSIKGQSRKLEEFRDKLIDECRQQVMGVEGSIARVYWQVLGNALPSAYLFQTRSRRPAKDIFNAALNYGYGMLYSVVEGGLFAAGLDPHLGILHADEHNKPTLAYDLIEPFRPWVDRLLIEECLSRKLEPRFFTKNKFGIFLNKHGKAFLIPRFNDFLRSDRPYLGQSSSVKNHIYFMAARLAQRIRAAMDE
ncbi:MAG: CRISPR-associated endonuclease Cas1 [Saprospiraceae bacterium]|nr:CRISPR-associated endonuclease Cas1 [Saprospiraceae bacterium]MCB0626828.1 CRISPR-associated endonuclease Cas1 [Saprospiraceae bacterium]MCB0677406.1 CRISPR-associated endonuclease Cas1 [Saprospiraceae bacterium]MCB0684404.1 CRISPR-associated endonuclease Cas1 [Saprospiraceae bacterium]